MNAAVSAVPRKRGRLAANTVPIERFVAVLAEAKPGGCWEWRGAKTPDGYGKMKVGIVDVRAHRFAYEFFRGAIPDGLLVRHTCDNPACVNPSHLLVGTDKDNSDDKVRRTRHLRGEALGDRRWGGARITEDHVREIRVRYAAGEAPKAIGIRYGISGGYVSQIVARRCWRHVE